MILKAVLLGAAVVCGAWAVFVELAQWWTCRAPPYDPRVCARPDEERAGQQRARLWSAAIALVLAALCALAASRLR